MKNLEISNYQCVQNKALKDNLYMAENQLFKEIVSLQTIYASLENEDLKNKVCIIFHDKMLQYPNEYHDLSHKE